MGPHTFYARLKPIIAQAPRLLPQRHQNKSSSPLLVHVWDAVLNLWSLGSRQVFHKSLLSRLKTRQGWPPKNRNGKHVNRTKKNKQTKTRKQIEKISLMYIKMFHRKLKYIYKRNRPSEYSFSFYIYIYWQYNQPLTFVFKNRNIKTFKKIFHRI